MYNCVMVIVKSANLALSFLLELCMLAALGYWGYKTGDGGFLQIALWIGAPLLVAIVWGILLAPASSRRLREPFHTLLEWVIFGLAFLALYATGQTVLTGIFVAIYAVNFILRSIWKQQGLLREGNQNE